METITIKPHHLLDIYKLHGAGIQHFAPNKKYRHDFYRIGNQILNHQVKYIQFTADADIICIPCRFCQEGICTDTFLHYGTETIKDGYNRQLDQKIIKLLNLKESTTYNYQHLLPLLSTHLTEPFINQVWTQNTKQDNQARYQKTIAGINKLI
ncbi:MAG: DUF1284 domain-containing protein [Lachnospiraceae bacterium]